MHPFRKEVPSILIQLICVCYFIRKHFIWNGFITFYVFMYTNICTSFTLKRAILLKNRSKHYLWIESWRRNPSARLLSDQDRISKLRPFISHVPRLEPRTSAFFLRCKVQLAVLLTLQVKSGSGSCNKIWILCPFCKAAEKTWSCFSLDTEQQYWTVTVHSIEKSKENFND